MRRPLVFGMTLLACVVATGPASSAVSVDRYSSVLNSVRALSKSPNVRTLPFGETITGRCVPAYVISDFSTPSAAKARIMICSGQHGDEFIAVKSVLALSRSLASGTDPELLKACVFVVVPMVNPDGVAADHRLNASNQDLNRGWRDLNQTWRPEAIHVDGLIKTWKPQLLIDAHEQTQPVPAGGNQIEVPHCLIAEQQSAINALSQRVAAVAGLKVINCRPLADKQLFHRNYACMGYGAYLLETSVEESATAKSRMYSSAILTMARALATDPKLGPLLSPSASDFGISAVEAYLRPTPASDPYAFVRVFYGFTLLAAGYVVCLWAIKPFSRARKVQWSRRFTCCEVDESVQINPLLNKQALTPITLRSWVNRRLRSRYAEQSPDQQTPEPEPEPQGIATFITPRYASQRTSQPRTPTLR